MRRRLTGLICGLAPACVSTNAILVNDEALVEGQPAGSDCRAAAAATMFPPDRFAWYITVSARCISIPESTMVPSMSGSAAATPTDAVTCHGVFVEARQRIRV